MSAENLIEFENGFNEVLITDGTESKRFQCNICEFMNTDKGGMKRHIHARHKMTGTKRGIDKVNHEEEDKRPKLDDFEPSLASTQIDENEKDEFEEVLLAEDSDYTGGLTFAGYSNEMLEKLGDLTAYEFENLDNNGITSTGTDHHNVVNAVINADFALDFSSKGTW